MSVVLAEETTPLLSSSSLPLPKQQTNTNNKRKATVWHMLIPLLILGFCAVGIQAPTIEIYTLIFCTRHYERLGEFSAIPMERCAIPEVQKTVAWIEGIVIILIYGSGTFVASFYGALSDRKGRVIISNITMIGYMIFSCCFILMTWYPISNFSVFLIIFGPLVHGLLAGGSVMLANSQAYLSDCTLPSERTLVFSYMMAALFLGSTLGPICASFLIKATGKVESIFYASLMIYFILFLYFWFFLPESMDFSALNDHNTSRNASATTKIENKKENDKALYEKLNVLNSLKIFKEAHIDTLLPYAGVILAFIQLLIQASGLPPFILYGMLRFGWTSYEGGIYLSVTSAAKLTSSILILPIITKIFNTSNVKFDIWMIRIGVISDVLRCMFSGLSANTTQYTIAGSLEAVSLFSQPSLRTLLISMVKPSQVGELMGALAIIDGFAILLSQLGGKGLYSATVSIMPNLTFYICAFVSFIGLLLSFSLRKPKNNRRTDLDV
ncbi:MFS general substrate transporter [Backusella circina FSU 941]|nr:MFS general substrate transporter [Backusella circina FSU 941]